MMYRERTLRRLSGSGFARPRAGAAAASSTRGNLDDAIEIDVDAPARARRRAEALARIRRREQAILRAFDGGCPEARAPREIAIRRWPAPAPALEAPRPNRELGAPVLPRDRAIALIPDAEAAAGFPSLTFNFVTGLLACSMLGWLAVWVVLRFCQ